MTKRERKKMGKETFDISCFFVDDAVPSRCSHTAPTDDHFKLKNKKKLCAPLKAAGWLQRNQ